MPFQPGQSGNPSGRPPKKVEDAQHSILLAEFDEGAERAIVRNMIAIAKRKNALTAAAAISAATWLWDRKYGKVKEPHDISGEMRIIVEYASADDADPDAS